MIIGIKAWAIGVGLATVAAGFLGAMIGTWKPGPSSPCRDSEELVSKKELERHCDPGARIEVYPAGWAGGPVALVKCVCPRVTP